MVVRMSSKPADREHPYGHRKFETIAVFGLATLLAVMAFELALSTVRKESAEIISGTWELLLMLTVLGINIFIATWQRLWARRLRSDILLADATHTLSDVMVTIVVIVGWQLSAMGHVWLDRLCALGVAALVLYLAYGLFRRAVPVLVDEFAIDPELLSNTVRNVEEVKQVGRVRSRWIGSMRAVDMVIYVDPSLSTERSHDISEAVESLIETRFGVSDISIHVEPYRGD